MPVSRDQDAVFFVWRPLFRSQMAASQRHQLGLALVQRWRDCRPPPGNATLLDELQETVRKAAKSWVNTAQASIFGSYTSGFCKKGSDADMAITWQTYNMFHHGHGLFEDQCMKKLRLVAGSMVDEGFANVRLVDSRTKHVSFTIPDSDVTCDITIGNEWGVNNSKIMGLICKLHPIVPIYVHTVKEWAKSKEVVASEKSCFNSFTITVMAVQVLQELGVVPVFSKPTGPMGELTLIDAQQAIRSHKLPPVYATIGPNDDAQLAEALNFLFQSFAQYYASFDFKTGTVSMICPRRKRTLYKEVATYYLKQFRENQRVAWEDWHKVHKLGPVDEEEFEDAIFQQQQQRVDEAPFVVEDFVNYINCGRRAWTTRVTPICNEFKELHQTLLTKPDLTVEQLMVKKEQFTFTMKNAAALKQVETFTKGRHAH